MPDRDDNFLAARQGKPVVKRTKSGRESNLNRPKKPFNFSNLLCNAIAIAFELTIYSIAPEVNTAKNICRRLPKDPAQLMSPFPDDRQNNHPAPQMQKDCWDINKPIQY